MSFTLHSAASEFFAVPLLVIAIFWEQNWLLWNNRNIYVKRILNVVGIAFSADDHFVINCSWPQNHSNIVTWQLFLMLMSCLQCSQPGGSCPKHCCMFDINGVFPTRGDAEIASPVQNSMMTSHCWPVHLGLAVKNFPATEFQVFLQAEFNGLRDRYPLSSCLHCLTEP